MKRIELYNLFARALILICLVIISQLQTSCSGCSPSGRKSHQKSLSEFKNSSEETERQIVKTLTPEVIKKERKEFLPLNDLYELSKNSVFLIYTSDGKKGLQGTGFFISQKGLAVSNYHVFEGTSQGLESIETIDGRKFKISEVLEKSKEKDYIIFRVKIDNFQIKNPLFISSQNPKIGEDVFAIGNPRGLESTLSKGIVSALRENNSIIQTTAEITHGSSGGPLLNMRGEVLGITTAGMGEANLNFAVNIEQLRLSRFISYE